MARKTVQPLQYGQPTGTATALPAYKQSFGRTAVAPTKSYLQQNNQQASLQNSRMFPNRTGPNYTNPAAYNKGIQAQISSLQAGMGAGTGWATAAPNRRASEQIAQLKQKLMATPKQYGPSATDLANNANQERYNQIISGRNQLNEAMRTQLNSRSDQAVKDVEHEFMQRESSMRDDLVSRGLRASTVASTNSALYGRAKSEAIAATKDRQVMEYIQTMVPLYNELYGVVERKNDIAPDPALMAQIAAQKGAGLTGWTPQDGYGGMQSVGMNMGIGGGGNMGGGQGGVFNQGGGGGAGGFQQQIARPAGFNGQATLEEAAKVYFDGAAVNDPSYKDWAARQIKKAGVTKTQWNKYKNS